MTLKLSACEDEDEAEELRKQRREHLIEADAGYAMRKHDFERAQVDLFGLPSGVCVCGCGCVVILSPSLCYATHLAQESRKGDPDWKVPADNYRTWDGLEFVSSDMAGVLQTPKVTGQCNASTFLLHISSRCRRTRHFTSEKRTLIATAISRAKGSNTPFLSGMKRWPKRVPMR